MARPTQWTLEKLVLNADGRWLVEGEEITHARTLIALHRGLYKDSEGYGVRVGPHSRPIEVEDTPCFVTAVSSTRAKCQLTLADGSKQPLKPESLAYRPGRLVCRVKAPWGEAEARFLRTAYHEFLKDLQEDVRGYFVKIGGKKIVLSRK